MFKFSTWIDGYGDALTKLGWSPQRVMEIKSMLAREVPAMHAAHAERMSQRAGMLQESPKIRQMAFRAHMHPREFSEMLLGKKAPIPQSQAVPPPIPAAARLQRAA